MQVFSFESSSSFKDIEVCPGVIWRFIVSDVFPTLREGYFLVSSTLCAVLAAVTIVATTSSIPIRGSFCSLVVHPKLKKLSVLALYSRKILSRDLIEQVQLFVLLPFKVIPLDVELQKFEQVRHLLPQGPLLNLSVPAKYRPEYVPIWAMFFLLAHLADQYIASIESEEKLLRAVYRDLVYVPQSLVSRIMAVNRSQRRQSQRTHPKVLAFGLSSIVDLILDAQFLHASVQLGPQKNNRLIALLDDGQSIFYFFMRYLGQRLVLEPTFAQFISNYINIWNPDCKNCINCGSFCYNKYMLDSTGSSLKNDLSPLIGPMSILNIIIFKMAMFKVVMLKRESSAVVMRPESGGLGARSLAGSMFVSSSFIGNNMSNRSIFTRPDEQKDWEKREAQHQFIKRSMGIPSSVTADPVANTVSDGSNCVIS